MTKSRLPYLFRFALFVVPIAPAHAAYFANASNINFGSLNIGALTGATMTGSVLEGCDPGYPTSGSLSICNAIGAGSNSASQTNRTMKFGVNAISYQLYINAAMTTQYAYPGSDIFSIPYSTAAGGSTTTTTYAKILSSTATLPPGTYTDTYSTTARGVATFHSFATAQCTNPAHTPAAIAFTVSVTLLASCSVTATNMTFPTTGVLSTAVDATSTLNVTCTNTTPYTVGLSAGTGAGATVASRKMTGPGGETVGYSLYRDSARGLVWGTTVGSTLAGTGTGSAQAITVYGRAPVQTTPAPGTYADMINVTVTY
jgi:spore coat protein U-like protein